MLFDPVVLILGIIFVLMILFIVSVVFYFLFKPMDITHIEVEDADVLYIPNHNRIIISDDRHYRE